MNKILGENRHPDKMIPREWGLVTNFPEGTGIIERTVRNLATKIGNLTRPFSDMDNPLDDVDKRAVRETLQIGDIVAVGKLSTISALIVGGSLTHVLLYKGEGQFIHSTSTGVEIISLEAVLEHYDTLGIIRPQTPHEHAAAQAINYAEKLIGTPFDFGFTVGLDALYCSELVANAYESVGVSMPSPKSLSKTVAHKILSRKIIHPEDFIGHGELVFMSHNLEARGGELHYIS